MGRGRAGHRAGEVGEVAGKQRSIADPDLDVPGLPQPDDPERAGGRDDGHAGGRTPRAEAAISQSRWWSVLGVGLVVGLVVGPVQEPAWVGFVVTSRWLAFRGKLPWKIMGFLDDAHRLGLLRTAGSVYQFRHAELQDHLAKSGETAAPVQPK